MRRTILLTSLLLATALIALPASAGHDDKGPRWDRYQHYDFRDRHHHVRPSHSRNYRPHHVREYRVIKRHHYRADRHHDRRHHHHDHDAYTIIGGAILLNEILHH